MFPVSKRYKIDRSADKLISVASSLLFAHVRESPRVKNRCIFVVLIIHMRRCRSRDEDRTLWDKGSIRKCDVPQGSTRKWYCCNTIMWANIMIILIRMTYGHRFRWVVNSHARSYLLFWAFAQRPWSSLPHAWRHRLPLSVAACTEDLQRDDTMHA